MLPDVRFTLVDGALGILPEQTDKLQLLLATSSAGPVNQVVGINSKEALRTRFGFGPLVESGALKLEVGGGPLYALRVATATPGLLSQVTLPTSTAPALTAAGAPYDFCDVRIKITSPGALGSAAFVYSLDGGESYSAEIGTAATYPLPDTGITLTFAAGAYVRGDVYAFVAIPPAYNPSGLSDAFDAALRDAREWGLVHVVGTPGAGTDAERASASAAMAAVVATKMAAAENAYRFARAVLEAPNVPDEALMTAFATFVGARVSVVAGFGRTLSPFDGTKKSRSVAWAILAQLMKKPIGKDPAQVEAGPGTGPLPPALLALARDERETPSLDAQRFVTARTHIGERGFFVTNFPLMSGAGSDFKYLQHGQVIDHACKVARGVLLKFLSRDLDLNRDGTLDEGQAQAIDQKLEDALRASLVRPGHASNISARTNRTDDVLATETLRGSLRVQPKFYPKSIEFDVGFTKTVPTGDAGA